MTETANDIITFWFNDIDSATWWKKDPKFDQLIKQRFGTLLERAAQNELFLWRRQAKSALAEVLVLDQFSRNVFRNSARAFANDALALCLAQSAIEKQFDKELTTTQRTSLYMPFMHSESKRIHELAVPLFESLGRPDNLKFELKHKAIIDRFGRYPHRNDVLGRASSKEELAFLEEPGSSF